MEYNYAVYEWWCVCRGVETGEEGVGMFCKCFEMYLCVSEMNLKENTWKLVFLFLKHWLFQAAALPKVINPIFINKGGGTVTLNNRGKQLKLYSFQGLLLKSFLANTCYCWCIFQVYWVFGIYWDFCREPGKDLTQGCVWLNYTSPGGEGEKEESF